MNYLMTVIYHLSNIVFGTQGLCDFCLHVADQGCYLNKSRKNLQVLTAEVRSKLQDNVIL